MKIITKGYAAALLVVGTSRFFLFADFMFFYDVLISPFFGGRKPAHPPKEIMAIVGILAVSSIVAPHPMDGLQTAFRIYILAMVLPIYKYGFYFKKMLGFTLGALALFAVAQSAFMTRSIGIHMNASMLGQTALVFAPVYWLEVGLSVAVIMTVSIARSPMVAMVIFAVFNRRKYYVWLVAITAGMFLVYASISQPDRITLSGVIWAIEDRIETDIGHSNDQLETRYSTKICGEFRPIEYSNWGYGFGGFCESTGQPRPHNIYVLSFYELGALFLPFWFLVMYAARRLEWWRLVPLLALGLVTDELFGRPEGVYLIAAWIISTHLLQTRRTPHAEPELR